MCVISNSRADYETTTAYGSLSEILYSGAPGMTLVGQALRPCRLLSLTHGKPSSLP
jgi:hypothetical protein